MTGKFLVTFDAPGRIESAHAEREEKSSLRTRNPFVIVGAIEYLQG